MKYDKQDLNEFINNLLDSLEGKEVDGIVPIDDMELIVFGTKDFRDSVLLDNPQLFTIYPKFDCNKYSSAVFIGNHFIGPNGIKFTLRIEDE